MKLKDYIVIDQAWIYMNGWGIIINDVLDVLIKIENGKFVLLNPFFYLEGGLIDFSKNFNEYYILTNYGKFVLSKLKKHLL